MRSFNFFQWISDNQPDLKHDYYRGWWNSVEFSQSLSSEFERFDFSVVNSFTMETPPPSSLLIMPVMAARSPSLEIFFKESWVTYPNYIVTIKWEFSRAVNLLDLLQPIDPANSWLLRDFPTELLYDAYSEGSSAFSGQVDNEHLLYSLFHVLSAQAGRLEEK